MTTKEKIEVMEAFERGEEIECSWTNCGTKWEIVKSPSWDWTSYLYRIKPKPKQTVTIEKWLCSVVENSYFIIEGTKEFMSGRGENVKLLDTYEVEL